METLSERQTQDIDAHNEPIRFAQTAAGIFATELIVEHRKDILATERNAVLHNLEIETDSGKQWQKVLVVNGIAKHSKEQRLDNQITFIMAPQFLSSPDKKSQRRIASTIATITGSTVVVPQLPGVSVDKRKNRNTLLTKSQKKGLRSGTFSQIGDSQWKAILGSEQSDNNNAGDFMSGKDRKIVFFGHSLGNNGNAGLLATLPEFVKEKVAGIIWSETPDVDIAKKVGEKSKDLRKRMSGNVLLNSKLYRSLNKSLGLSLARQRTARLRRGFVNAMYGPVAIAKHSIEQDIETAHNNGGFNFSDVPQMFYRAGRSSTTLIAEQMRLKDLLKNVLDAPIIVDKTLRGETHGYINGLPVATFIAVDSLRALNLWNGSDSRKADLDFSNVVFNENIDIHSLKFDEEVGCYLSEEQGDNKVRLLLFRAVGDSDVATGLANRKASDAKTRNSLYGRGLYLGNSPSAVALYARDSNKSIKAYLSPTVSRDYISALREKTVRKKMARFIKDQLRVLNSDKFSYISYQDKKYGDSVVVKIPVSSDMELASKLFLKSPHGTGALKSNWYLWRASFGVDFTEVGITETPDQTRLSKIQKMKIGRK